MRIHRKSYSFRGHKMFAACDQRRLFVQWQLSRGSRNTAGSGAVLWNHASGGSEGKACVAAAIQLEVFALRLLCADLHLHGAADAAHRVVDLQESHRVWQAGASHLLCYKFFLPGLFLQFSQKVAATNASLGDH